MSYSARVAVLRDLVAQGRLNGSARFAASLCDQYARKGRLSDAQGAWIDKLIERGTNPPPPPTTSTLTGDVAGIFSLFRTTRLKWPKISLAATDGTPVRLSRAGPNSKYTGQIQITDGGPFGSNRYFGRVDEQGVLTEGRAMTPAVRELLVAFAAEPARVAAEYGKRTGNCCFCSRGLETDESLSVGYGPVCAKNFGLPWGAVEAAPATV